MQYMENFYFFSTVITVITNSNIAFICSGDTVRGFTIQRLKMFGTPVVR